MSDMPGAMEQIFDLQGRLRAAEAERDKWHDANERNAAKVQELEDAESLLKAERDSARAEVARLREAVGDTIARWLTRGDFNLVSGIRAALAAQPEPGAAQEGQ